MMRNLPAERFGVKAHSEMTEFAAYDLLIAKGGSKLKEAANEPVAIVADDGFPKLTKPRMQTIFKTWLQGKFDFKLEYSPGDASASGQDNEVGVGGRAYAIKGPGLELRDTKTTLDVVVVDHAERVATKN
jgi:Protein of unknown function (DUF3738)